MPRLNNVVVTGVVTGARLLAFLALPCGQALVFCPHKAAALELRSTHSLSITLALGQKEPRDLLFTMS